MRAADEVRIDGTGKILLIPCAILRGTIRWIRSRQIRIALRLDSMLARHRIGYFRPQRQRGLILVALEGYV